MASFPESVFPIPRTVGIAFAALLLPALYIFLVIYLDSSPIQPLFMDPDYIYLVNGHLVAHGAWPKYYDSPGTTLQFLNGFFFLFNKASTSELIRRDTHYYTYIILCLTGLNAVAIGALALLTRLRNMPWYFVVLLQIPFLTAPINFGTAMRIMPETLAPVIMVLFLFAYISEGKKKVVLLPLVCAIAVATKLYYWPLALSFFALGGLRNFCKGAVIFLLATTTFFSGYAHDKLVLAFHYYSDLLWHNSYGGTGTVGLPSFSDELVLAKNLFFHLHDYSLVLIFAMMVPAFFLVAQRERRSTALVLVFLFLVLSVLKYPFQHYYMLPSILILPVLAAEFWQKSEGKMRVAVCALLALATLVQWAEIDKSLLFRRISYAERGASKRNAESWIAANPECEVLVYGGVPYTPMAFWFAGISDYGALYSDLASVFPQHWFTRNQVEALSFAGKIRPLAKFADPKERSAPCLFLYASYQPQDLQSSLLELLPKFRFLVKEEVTKIYLLVWPQNYKLRAGAKDFNG